MAYLKNTNITGSLTISGSIHSNVYRDVSGIDAWTLGGFLTNPRQDMGGTGTQNAALAFGGCASSVVSCTEEYNGTSWATGGALSTARCGLAGAGTQNVGLGFGGGNRDTSPPCSCTEEYNGTSWATGGALVRASTDLAGAGTQNAGLAVGGANQDDGLTFNYTEEYNGTSWSTGGALSIARAYLGGAGTQNAGLAFGGLVVDVCSNLNYTEEYNGTSWSTGGALNVGKDCLAGSGTSQTDAFAAEGSSCSEHYNGSTWSSRAALLISKSRVAGAGTQNEGLVVGAGRNNIFSDGYTQEYLYSPSSFANYSPISTANGQVALTGGVVFNKFLLCYRSTWSTGGALNIARESVVGAGTQNAALAFGGCTNAAVSCTEEYNGTSWSTGGALATARTLHTGFGTQNAGLATAGFSVCVNTEEYNGTSWSTGGNIYTGVTDPAGAGTQNAGLIFGGLYSDDGEILPWSQTISYNGTSWSTLNLNDLYGSGLIKHAGAGTQNAALSVSGEEDNSISSYVQEFNGTTWLATALLNVPRKSLAATGTQNEAITFGGYTNAVLSCTEEYNGTSWSTGGALSTGRCELAGAGTQAEALAFGGFSGASVSCTEESSLNQLQYEGITSTFEHSATTGNTTVSCLIETSARRYKDNIKPMQSQLSKIMQLEPVEFDWKYTNKHDIGFVADSVKNLYPNLISTNELGEIQGMNYTKLISALVKSIQEQQYQIDKLTQDINNISKNCKL